MLVLLRKSGNPDFQKERGKTEKGVKDGENKLRGKGRVTESERGSWDESLGFSKVR